MSRVFIKHLALDTFDRPIRVFRDIDAISSTFDGRYILVNQHDDNIRYEFKLPEDCYLDIRGDINNATKETN